MVALPASLSALSFPLTPACPGQYTHRILRRWMSNIDTCQSGPPIPFFTCCSRLNESVRMMACVVWLSSLEAIQRGTCVCFHFHCQAGDWVLIGFTAFVDGGRILLKQWIPALTDLWLRQRGLSIDLSSQQERPYFLRARYPIPWCRLS